MGRENPICTCSHLRLSSSLNEIVLACYSALELTRQGLPTISRSPSEEDCPRKLAFLALHAVSELDGFGFHDVLI